MAILDEKQPGLDTRIWRGSGKGVPPLKTTVAEAIRAGAKKVVGSVPVKDAYLVGSLTGYRYTDESDMDVTIIVDVDDDELEVIRDRTKQVNGFMAPGTKHPVHYYVLNNLPGLERYDGVYDLKGKRWVREPRDHGIDLFTVYDQFLRYVEHIDEARAEALRSIMDVKIFHKILARGGDPKIIGYKLIRRLKDLDHAIKTIVSQYDEAHQERINAFKRFTELAAEGVKPLPSPNVLPENIRYKLLERYHYLDFMVKLLKFMEKKDKISLQDVPQLQEILEYVLDGVSVLTKRGLIDLG